MQLLNFGIIKNPINWITVLLMVLIAGIAMNAILHWSRS